jgi:hypothetical protein
MNKRLWIAAAVAAAVLAGGIYVVKAHAGDLGGKGGDYADLEERISELEATTVRKGNRKVSLSISGYVTHSVMAWDDGGQKDVYIGDGGAVSSRFRLTGDAKVSPDLTAGFLYEFGVHSNKLGSMTQADGGDDLGGAVSLRDSTVWLRHKSLGMMKIGHGSTATDNLILIDLGGVGSVMSPDVGVFNGAFGTRVDTLTINGTAVPGAAGVLTPLVWNQLLNGGVTFDTARRNHVLYETPAFMGASVQAAIGEDNFWDVALRLANEAGGFRFAGGIGYSVDAEAPTFGPFGITAASLKEYKGSASVMHVSTGLFVTAAGGMREIDWNVAIGAAHKLEAKDAHFWHVAAGWSKNLTGMGNTVFYGEYQQAKDMMGYSLSGPAFNGSVSSDATVWGFGVVQHIDSAAMELFLAYKNFSGDVTGSLNTPGPDFDAKLDVKDFQAIIGGAKINF